MLPGAENAIASVLPSAADSRSDGDQLGFWYRFLAVRQWKRYFARMFDMFLAYIVFIVIFTMFLIILMILNPEAAYATSDAELEELSQAIALSFYFFLPLVWIFIEAGLLSTLGTTPRKWLFNLRIIAPSGGKPNYSAALSRSFKLWWYGPGMGMPFVTSITQVMAYGKLARHGITSWDR